MSGLELFEPRISAWFDRRYGAPTEIQRLAWPRIAAGEHLLISAPTGSGKTLTGFLWAIDRLAGGAWETGGGVRVLYVSPLKALNADIERNLAEPLAGIGAAYAAAGATMPAIRVGVRSGDTPASERQRLLRSPPEILITTPESLNLLLLSKSAPRLFAGLQTVILDEIHAVAGNKRGAHLITAVDRLVPLAGEFQRLGISATVKPLERVAAWMGGAELRRGADGAAVHRPRQVAVVRSTAPKRYDLEVRIPPALAATAPEEREGDVWRLLAIELRERIAAARSTIVFTNSRRTAEKLTRLINDEAGREIAWSHHGSLSRELRQAVEARLKRGELPALVATSSLELGIDVGALDQVLLVQSPRSLASAAQRVGRAGHGVGEVSRARLYPTHARDLLECAVAARAVLDGEIEPVTPVESPLDLLAQWLLAMTAHEAVSLDVLYETARASSPYRHLPRRQFDLVVEMLAGRYEEARIAELKPRLAVDRLTGEARARPGTVRLLAQAGGTIPDRGYFQLRTEETNARLGELDEEFVWERSLGDVFLLGTQSWRIRRITSNEVFVSPARGGTPLAPFWRADGRNRGAVFSERIAALLERLDARLDRDDLERELMEEDCLDAVAAGELVRQLRDARAALGGELPHRRRIVFEEVADKGLGVEGSEAARHRQLLLYTFWGGTLNRPLAMALAAAFEEAEGYPAESYADDDAVLLRLPAGVDPRALLARVGSERIEELLRSRLEGSGLFGAQFRQNAQRALLLPRSAPGRRTPLWLSRESAKRLLEAVERFDDFPVTLESWRSTLRDELDLPGLRAKLEALEAGEIAVAHVRSDRPSPLASGLLWKRTNDLVYEDDVPAARRGASLRADLVREIALGERPPIPRELVERYRRKVQRLLPGYAPQGAGELLEWVKERLYLPEEEWEELVAAIERDRPGSAAEAVEELAATEKLAADGGGRLARESLERRLRSSPERFEEWLRYEPPLALPEAARKWGVSSAELEALLAPLVESERVVHGRISEGAGGEPEVATMDAVRTLLRWRRAAARPELEPAPLERLPLFVATWQGLADRGSGPEALQASLERLFGYVAPAALWEAEILPARIEGYLPGALDTLFDESPLRFFGDGRERIGFAFATDLDLFPAKRAADAEERPEVSAVRAALVAAPRGLDIDELLERTQLASSEIVPALWDLVAAGEVAGDSIRLLRQGIDHGFAAAPPRPSEAPERGAGGRRGLVRRWQLGRASLGRWHPRPAPAEGDAIAEAEAARELARLLLERYGVLFRELAVAELPGQWAGIFRALRGLELSGEIVAGSFFHGVPGLQFALPRAVEALRDGGALSATWWCSAVDPASFCGTGLDALRPLLPRRIPANRLVYRGARLVAVLKRGGAEIEIAVPPEDREVSRLVEPLRVTLTRAVAPERAVDVETINGEPAANSAYRHAFDAFDTARLAGDALRLRRRYGSPVAIEDEGAERIASHVPAARLGSVGDERNDN